MIRDNCITHIMHHEVMDKLDDLEYYKGIGIKNYRLELFDEGYEEVVGLINRFYSKGDDGDE